MTLVCVLLPAPAMAGATWSVAPPAMEIEGDGLSRDAIFDRIDSLESLADRSGGPELVELQWRLAQLYISTDMPKHRRHALDLLDQVSAKETGDARADQLWAALAHRMHYDSEVRERLERAAERHPEDVGPLLALGAAELRVGLERLGEERLRHARNVFRQAVRTDSTRAEVWHGMAVSALALGEYRAVRRAARSLTRFEPELGLMLAAAAHQRLADPQTASARFTEALELMDPAERAVFVRGEGFLDADDLAVIAEAAIPRAQAFAILRERGEDPQPGDEIDWEIVLEDPQVRERVLSEWWTGHDERPAQAFSTGELEYWARLVEADALFGRPPDGVRGWATPAGDVWVRWGRPTSTFYDPGSPGAASRVDAMAAAGVRFPPETVLPVNAPAIWVWTYRWPGTWISFLFTDQSRTKSWSPSESSRHDLSELNAKVPIRLERVEREEPFDLAVSSVAFPRAGADALVETYVGFEPTPWLRDVATDDQLAGLMFADRDTIALVDWSVSDAAGEQIDSVHRVVGPGARRSRILEQLGHPVARGATDPYLLAVGARLPAGRYRIGVEVRDPVTMAWSAREFGFTVPDPVAGDLLEMSGLQLAAAFTPWTAGAQVPQEFVKYATAVVPAPSHRVPRGAATLGVYFEVRNLALDDERRNSFDVHYAVYRSTREIRDLAFRDEPDVEGLELVAPASLEYLEESTGVSPEGLVIKGTELDVGDLAAGDYVLVVTIDDRIARDSVSRAAAFRISSP